MARYSTSSILTLAVVGAAVMAAMWWVSRPADVSPAPANDSLVSAQPAFGEPAPFPAGDVLHAWDRRRARAYAHDDAAALRSLYATGSRAGAADLRVLQSYRSRGLRVRGMRMQVLGLEVLGSAPGRWKLRVTDRLGRAVAVGVGTRTVLPRDQASTHTLVLERTSGRWQMVAVRISR